MQDAKKKSPSRSSIDAYRRTDVMTANRETILLMMYAGAMRFLNQAIEASERNDGPERSRFITKTQEIINELRATLNFEIGGEIAVHLDGLYAFVTKCLLEANLEKNTNRLREALEVISTLNSAWEAAIASLKKERAQTDKT